MKLSDRIDHMPGVGPAYALKLKKLGINTLEDLLLHIPARHLDFRNKTSIGQLKIGEEVTITGQVVSIQNIYTKTGKQIQIAKISDGVDSVDAIWVRQPYLLQIIPPGTFISLSGKLGFWGRKKAFAFPQYEKFTGDNLHTGRLVPIYPETAGVSSKWLRSKLRQALSELETEDFLNETDKAMSVVADYKEALRKIHFAENLEEFEIGYARLAFNELLMLQIENNLKKLWWQENTRAENINISSIHTQQFLASLPFELTPAQKKAMNEILFDITKEIPMNRLLEGDVGSGKTVVAASAIFATFLNAKKSVVLAPTQILAQQHFETLNKLLTPFKTRISLVTGDGIISDFGSSDVIVGTHALLFREFMVSDTAFLVIDEQHRFGVKQRAKIAEIAAGKEKTPHILTMTATPIPRTIALTLYGDLDLSTLDELPKGRKKVKTWVIPKAKRKKAEEWIKQKVKNDGDQVFVVCPLIEESEAETLSEVKAVTIEYERLKKVFKNLAVALLHGKMKSKEKNKIIKDFKAKKYDILVSTPVIEVGIDIPNATIMVIEAAERFGLAQLHQLRGRVGRGEKESYCLLFSETKSGKAKDRLKKVAKAGTGKELAELDLEIRGPGEIFGVRQHGLPELRIAKWNDYELIKKTRDFAKEVVSDQIKYKTVIQYYRNKQLTRN